MAQREIDRMVSTEAAAGGSHLLPTGPVPDEWGQLIYQMGLPSLLGESSKRAQLALERSQAVLGTPGSVFVRLLDKDFNSRKDPKVDAVLEYLDACSAH